MNWNKVKDKKGKLKYFTSEMEPSHAEARIMAILKKNRVPYLREVSFENFKSPKGGYYRYDFYFPNKNLIIEYDGKDYHLEGNENDIIKNKFCKKNKIRLVRLNLSSWHHLERSIKNILCI